MSAVSRGDLPTPSLVLHQFLFPQKLVGILIRKGGKNFRKIKERSGADVTIEILDKTTRKPKHQLVSIKGTQEQVEQALQQIQQKFLKNEEYGINYRQVWIIQQKWHAEVAG